MNNRRIWCFKVLSLGVGALLYVGSNSYESTKHKETSMHLTRLGTCWNFEVRERELFICSYELPQGWYDDQLGGCFLLFRFYSWQNFTPIHTLGCSNPQNYVLILTISLNIFSHKNLILSKIRANSQILT